MGPMNILYKNDEKLRELGIIENNIIRKIILKIFKIFEAEIDPTISKMDIDSIIETLENKNVPPYYGTISPLEGDKERVRYLFETNDGTRYILSSNACAKLDEKLHGQAINISNVYMFAQRFGEENFNGVSYSAREPIVMVLFEKALEHARIAPIGIPGLEQLLFPDKTDKVGFELPFNSQKIVPKIILIKGAPGTGKTTMAVQIMISMAKAGTKCAYWCSNDTNRAISEMASSYDFCTPQEMQNLPLTISHIEDKYFKHVTLEGNIKKSLEGTDVLFFDSLNVSQIKNDVDRNYLWNIFRNFKSLDTLVFFLLEDYGKEGSERVRQLIADCEFLADVVIELGEGNRLDYETRHLRIAKKHYGGHTFGTHIYKICQAIHPTSNIYVDDPAFKGIIVYPSIHHYLSMARGAKPASREQTWVHTGITHLDSILSGESLDNTKRIPNETFNYKCIPNNSCIVISGPKGLHKLAIGLNILLGGLWELKDNKAQPSKDVLVIQLAEESYVDMTRVAIARRTDVFMQLKSEFGSLDNGRWISLRDSDKESCPKLETCLNREMLEQSDTGKKIKLNKWCFDILDTNKPTGDCRKVVVAGFRPGYITPEEFISCITKLMKAKKCENDNGDIMFSRVLFISTAHLQSGFPMLYAEPLLLRALTDSFKANGLVSIFLDVRGEGSDKELSFGLESMADYHIQVTPFGDLSNEFTVTLPDDQQRMRESKKIIEEWEQFKRGLVWGRLEVENVRGKDYSRSAHGITVVPRISDRKNKNELFICDTNVQSKYSPKFNPESKDPGNREGSTQIKAIGPKGSEKSKVNEKQLSS